jgi:death on curing protein
MTMREAPIWLLREVILAVHEEQLAEHGGLAGIRDAGMLDFALARPEQLFAYGAKPDIAQLAAAYGFGIARNHPFAGGNKRTAFVAIELFLALNGYDFNASDEDCVLTILALAAGEMEEAQLAAWVRANAVKANA